MLIVKLIEYGGLENYYENEKIVIPCLCYDDVEKTITNILRDYVDVKQTIHSGYFIKIEREKENNK